ncbi:hypothetical protein [Nitrosomonas sp.]
MMSAVISQIYPLFMTITYSGDELFLQLRSDLLDYLCRKLSKDEAAEILQEIYQTIETKKKKSMAYIFR